MAYHRQQGVNTCIARIFNTFGARMRPHDGRAIPTFLRQALQDKPVTVFGDGSQTRSFCYVDDLIRGLDAARRVRRAPARQPRQPQGDDPAGARRGRDRGDRVALGDRLRGAAGRRPAGPPARHHPCQAAPRLGAARSSLPRDCGARSSRRASSASSAPPTDRAAAGGYGAPVSRASLRIAHLTATFPPYPGGAGNTCYRFATGQAERGHHVEVFTAPADGEPPDPGEAVVHRIEPAVAIGNAPLIPSLARIEGFDVVHLHYPFIFGSELTLLGRMQPTAPAPGAARPLQEPAGRKGRPPGRVRGLRAHGRAAPGRAPPTGSACSRATTPTRSPICAGSASATRRS